MEIFHSLDDSRYCTSYTLDSHASDISSGELNTSPKLRAYTPALFTSSFTRVLVYKLCVTVTSPTLGLNPTLAKWVSIFRSDFTLRCIQRLSIMAQLLDSALSDNRYTVGHAL